MRYPMRPILASETSSPARPPSAGPQRPRTASAPRCAPRADAQQQRSTSAGRARPGAGAAAGSCGAPFLSHSNPGRGLRDGWEGKGGKGGKRERGFDAGDSLESSALAAAKALEEGREDALLLMHTLMGVPERKGRGNDSTGGRGGAWGEEASGGGAAAVGYTGPVRKGAVRGGGSPLRPSGLGGNPIPVGADDDGEPDGAAAVGNRLYHQAAVYKMRQEVAIGRKLAAEREAREWVAPKSAWEGVPRVYDDKRLQAAGESWGFHPS